jgi:hypothetical protein
LVKALSSCHHLLYRRINSNVDVIVTSFSRNIFFGRYYLLNNEIKIN